MTKSRRIRWAEKLKKIRGTLGDLGVDGRIILK
jgi:hypothetical protein